MLYLVPPRSFLDAVSKTKTKIKLADDRQYAELRKLLLNRRSGGKEDRDYRRVESGCGVNCSLV